MPRRSRLPAPARPGALRPVALLLAGALVILAAPPAAQPRPAWQTATTLLAATDLPDCAGGPNTGRTEPSGPPVLRESAPGTATPRLCRAEPTAVLGPDGPVATVPPAAGTVPVPRPGYHHLGAASRTEWSGVLGRMTVRDTGARPGSYDFVAARFMVKQDVATPEFSGTAWLEVGWSENGWLGDNRPRIYTFHTNDPRWTFYDQYQIRPGNTVWFYLEADRSGNQTPWHAWLWWNDTWNLLTDQVLPLGEAGLIEQYVEVYVDPERGGQYSVPAVTVDNVQVKTGPAGELRYWRDPAIETDPGAGIPPYCLVWQQRFDTWSAGDC